MPELDAEHRDQMAAVLLAHREDGAYPNTCLCETEAAVNVPEEHYPDHIADALAPLVAGWLADAWDAGWNTGFDDLKEYQSDGGRPESANPYRGGNDG